MLHKCESDGEDAECPDSQQGFGIIEEIPEEEEKLVEKETEDVNDDTEVEKLTRQKAPDTDSYSNSYKLGVIACMILGGSFTTIFAKTIEMEIWLPKQTVNSQVPDWVLTEFKHPLIMNLLKFAGESILLPILSFKLIKDP